ncbi:MAG: penicillin acylase family protein [Pirellulaceae bacterium]
MSQIKQIDSNSIENKPASEDSTSKMGGKGGKWRRRLLRFGLVCVGLVLLVVVGVYFILRSSLPIRSGSVQLANLEESVRIERDELGIPTIFANSRQDAAQALGFLHAQERFFQMDLLRRRSAGTLSSLFGLAIAASDEMYRKHQFQRLANEVFENLPAEHQRLLKRYAVGVNQGLEKLGSSPFEYWLLSCEPEEWNATDSLLVLYTMQTDLQDADGRKEMGLVRLHEAVEKLEAPELYDFLIRRDSTWDAPLDDSVSESQPAIPGPEVFSLRNATARTKAEATGLSSNSSLPSPGIGEFLLGSNSFAVSGELNSDGRSLLANDMHLGLQVPTIWYRAMLRIAASGNETQLAGATLPGVPTLIIGSNQHIAWGLTNGCLDVGDIVELNMLADSTTMYTTPDGPRELQVFKEIIGDREAGEGKSKAFEYEWSVWGPVVASFDGRKFVHHWTGNDPLAANFNLAELEKATTAAEALRVATSIGCTHCNFTVADSQGNIGWTIVGRLPQRSSGAAKRALDWSKSGSTWSGFLSAEDYPQVLNPPAGILWSANNRKQGGEYARAFAGFFARDGRATQIRDSLRSGAKNGFTEEDLLKIQLDDRAKYLENWHKWLSDALEDLPQNDPRVSHDFCNLLSDWDGHAGQDSFAFAVVSEFRIRMLIRFLGLGTENNRGLLIETLGLEPQSIPFSFDAVLEDLLEERPMHWLPAEHETWDDLIIDVAVEVEQILSESGPMEEQTWGTRNEVRVQHPVSLALPPLATFLDMKAHRLPGASGTPRAQGKSFGASQRMVVSPGQEEEAIFHQPGGQSGHPLSSYYRKGFDAWADGRPTSLLPGNTLTELILRPSLE